MDSDLLLILLLVYFIWIILVGLSIQGLLIFSIIHCVIKEKDNTKRLFWILTILVTGAFGTILYIFHRIPTRKREEKDPEFHSTIEYRIMDKISFKRKPTKKIIFKRRWNKKFRFISFYTISILLLTGFIITMVYFMTQAMSSSGINSDNELDPTFFLYTYPTLILVMIAILLTSPYTGWNRILIEGMNVKDVIKYLISRGYERSKFGYKFQMKGGPSIIIEPIQMDREISYWLEDQGITLKRKKNAMMLVSIETVRNGSNMKLRESRFELPIQMKMRPTKEFYDTFSDLKNVRLTDLTYSNKKKIGEP